MKKLTAASIFLVSLALASNATAAPIDFETSLEGSSVVISNKDCDAPWWVGGCADNWSIDLSPIDGQTFRVEEGESYEFDFFTITMPSHGWGEATVNASLMFESPGPVVGSGSGDGEWGNAFGVFSGGALTWTMDANPIVLADGTSFDLVFNDIAGLQFLGSSATIKATVTARSAAAVVPEPGALALLGLGLVAIGVSSRRV